MAEGRHPVTQTTQDKKYRVASNKKHKDYQFANESQ